MCEHIVQLPLALIFSHDIFSAIVLFSDAVILWDFMSSDLGLFALPHSRKKEHIMAAQKSNKKRQTCVST